MVYVVTVSHVTVSLSAGHVYLFKDGKAIPFQYDEFNEDGFDRLHQMRPWLSTACEVFHKAKPAYFDTIQSNGLLVCVKRMLVKANIERFVSNTVYSRYL